MCVNDCSIQAAEHYAQVSENIRTDPMRLAAQVISGIGFLGAGVILHKKNDAISGLTTAAIIWASAGIGIAAGRLRVECGYRYGDDFIVYSIKSVGSTLGSS